MNETFKTLVRVSWVETDAAQVVHFSNYFRYFEKAEEEFYRSISLSFSTATERGLWFPRVESFCQYHKPARFNDLLAIELVVEEMREKSVKYGFKVLNDVSGEELAQGYMVLVAASTQTGKAIAVPQDFAEKLKPFTKHFSIEH